VFTFTHFSIPSHFVFNLDLKNGAVISICLVESAAALGRREGEQPFPASPEEQGECEGGEITLEAKLFL